LIVLNACELAQPDERLVSYTPFSNLAASFLNAGAAIVVAMQYPIRTDTASIFAKTFYGQVGPYLFASAQNIEEAVQEARHAIARAQNAVEWITPVVFTRMQGEEIFRIPEARLRVYAEDIQKREKMNKLLGEARTLFDNGAWVDAAEKVKEILQIDPTEEEALKLKNELVRIASDKIQDQNQEEILGKNIFNALK
jgi:hypothetical protein